MQLQSPMQTQASFYGINLSTKYQKHNSLGILAVERCADLVKQAIQLHQKTFYILRL